MLQSIARREWALGVDCKTTCKFWTRPGASPRLSAGALPMVIHAGLCCDRGGRARV